MGNSCREGGVDILNQQVEEVGMLYILIKNFILNG